MISIIIPIYNHIKEIEKCVDSIKAQTYKDIEVIFIEDGSTDATEDEYRELIAKLHVPNSKFLFHRENKRAPAARNTGFRESKGEYLLFCDADSILKYNTLEIMLNTLKDNPSASYAYSSFLWGHKLFKVGEWSEEKLKSGPCIHTMALIRREDYPKDGWDESILKLQDWDLWLTMLENGKRGIWIDKVLFNIKPGGVYSDWLPSFAYKLFPFLAKVKRYDRALAVARKKHNL